MMDRVEQLIRADKKYDFVSFVRSQMENAGSSGCMFSPSDLLNLICLYLAVDCASALLGGETGVCVDVNAALESGLLPLQVSAQSLSFSLTKTLLQHGADANVCGSKDLSLLPLSMALKALCGHHASDWTSEKSVLKLLYIFCLPDLKEPLETIKSLAEQTEEVEKVSLCCVEKGEVIQLAALLMAAWDRVICSSVENVERALIGKHIWRQMEIVFREECRLTINCGPNCEVLEHLKTKKLNLLAGWKVLKILETARDVIHNYRHSSRVQGIPKHEVPFDVAYQLFDRTDLVLCPDDVYANDIECLRFKFKAEDKAVITESIENELRSGSIFMNGRTEHEAGQKEYSVLKNQWKMLYRTPVTLPGKCCSWMPPMSSSLPRPYHTSGGIVSACEPMEILLPRNTQKAAIPSISMSLPSAKICGRLLLCMKRL